MTKPKEKRDRLFKDSRPLIRPLVIYQGEQYHKDIGILWVAHTKKPFYVLPPDLDQQRFALEVEALSRRCDLYIADDHNAGYRETGPVALIGATSDGWRVEPHCEFFAWASARNKLRITVAFIQMIKHRNIGACVIKSLANSKALFDKSTTYFSPSVFCYVGRIPAGDPRGDEYQYSVRGKKNVR